MSPLSWPSLCIQNPEGTVSQGFLHPLPWAAWEMMVKLLPAHDWLSVYEVTWFSFFHISGMPFYALGVEWWLMNALVPGSEFRPSAAVRSALLFVASCGAQHQGDDQHGPRLHGVDIPRGSQPCYSWCFGLDGSLVEYLAALLASVH